MVKYYIKDFKEFLHDKKFIVLLILTAMLSYGFMLTHYSIGVDDLCFDRYVKDTWILSAGRWGTWITYNIFGIKDFTPFWLDFVCILILIITAITLCALFKRVTNNKLKRSSYIIFACSYISYPVLSNYLLYQSTNLTVSLSNLIMVYILWYLYETFKKDKKIKLNFLLILFITFPISMYESCCQTYLVVMFIIAFLDSKYNDESSKNIFKYCLMSILTLGLGIVLNLLIGKLIYLILNKLDLLKPDVSNKMSFLEVITKDNIFNYLTNKLIYLLANLDLLIFMVIGAILVFLNKKKRQINIIIYIFIILSNFLLLFYVYNTLYRMYYSWAITLGFIFLIINEFNNYKKYNVIFNILFFILIFSQTKEMNQLFYNDYRGYLRDVNYVNNIIYELNTKVEDNTKPLLLIVNQTDLLTKLYINSDNRYDLLSWGSHAFNEKNIEILKFINYQGYKFKLVKNYDEAYNVYSKLPNEEKNKNIIELEDFIVVKINIDFN